MLLQAENLSFRYGRKPVLQGVSLAVDAGECLAVSGPNGSGKSTLLALLAGILRPRGGTITRSGQVALVPQSGGLLEDLSVARNLDFFASLAGLPFPSELPLDVEPLRRQRVGALSGGQKKRVSIACALAGGADVLLLDEPCAGLDFPHREEMLRLIAGLKAQGKAILYVSHDPTEFGPVYDRLLFLSAGTGRCYTPAELSVYSGLGEAYTVLCCGSKPQSNREEL